MQQHEVPGTVSWWAAGVLLHWNEPAWQVPPPPPGGHAWGDRQEMYCTAESWQLPLTAWAPHTQLNVPSSRSKCGWLLEAHQSQSACVVPQPRPQHWV